MQLETVLRDLYRSEINFHISCFWDGGIEVKLGDDMNGYIAECTFESADTDKIAMWLTRKAVNRFPSSEFANQHCSDLRVRA